MVVRKAAPLPVEAIVRGYLSGSGRKDYERSGRICGINLPVGLVEGSRLPEPIFTPSTKAESGHDINMSYEQVLEMVGPKAASVLSLRSLALYKYAAEYARQRGIIIADTKFEFGWVEADGEEALIVIDEALTPDSSRFWPAESYRPGGPQPSFDKQPVRDWLTASGWNKQPPAPELPPEVVASTSERYREAYRRLTGLELFSPREG